MCRCHRGMRRPRLRFGPLASCYCWQKRAHSLGLPSVYCNKCRSSRGLTPLWSRSSSRTTRRGPQPHAAVPPNFLIPKSSPIEQRLQQRLYVGSVLRGPPGCTMAFLPTRLPRGARADPKGRRHGVAGLVAALIGREHARAFVLF